MGEDGGSAGSPADGGGATPTDRRSDDAAPSPAYYAARSGRFRDWWTLLHPPYTAWHLAYVVIGASLAAQGSVWRLLATIGAFFLAVGVAAHALDELRGRPLRTSIPTRSLVAAAVVGLAGALGLGIVGVALVGWPMVPFMIVGPVVVVAYNFELFGGRLHNEATFALAWGAFPVLTGYVAQSGDLGLAPVLAGAGAVAFSVAQRRLSTPARLLRRRAEGVEGSVTIRGGEPMLLDRSTLLAPLEQALRAMSWAVVWLATAIAVARFT